MHWRTVIGWAKAGCPHERDRKKVYRFNIAEVVGWLRSEGKSGRPGRPRESGSSELDKLRMRKERALAEKYELELAERRGQLLDAADVEAERVGRIIAVKTAWGGMIKTLAGEMEGLERAAIGRLLESRARDMFRLFARGRKAE